MVVDFTDNLKDLVGPDHVLVSPASLVSYGIDATVGYRGEPLAAVFPRNGGRDSRPFGAGPRKRNHSGRPRRGNESFGGRGSSERVHRHLTLKTQNGTLR